ncbi:MAG: hypothetical protein H7336_11195 [Bacteriovorax sp.]|nr:hypothetical protein [Bacteriovorax sp.]
MFKTSLFTVALMTTAFISSNALQAKTFDPFTNPPKVISQAVKDVYAGVKFNYLDRADRVMIVKDLLSTVELEYALLPLKAKRVNLDFAKLKEDALNTEMMADVFIINAEDRKSDEARDRIANLQAQGNMDFLDRMQALVAKFQDTHFSLQEKIARPFIYNGVRLMRVDGKIVVASLDKKFLGMVGKLSDTDFSGISIGDEVTAIDGVAVEAKIKGLKNYLGGSSDEFIDYGAVRALTLRNFKYEKKNYMKISFANGAVLKLPIFANDSLAQSPRVDALTFFKKYNIPSDSSAIGIAFDKTTGKWTDSTSLNFSGYSILQLKENLKGVTEYLDDTNGPAIRTGYYINKGKTYAVMQLLTFYTKNVHTATAENPFLDAIRAFAVDAKENSLPVILDLRFNGGGNGNYPAAVLSIFTEADKKYGANTSGFRLTPYMRGLEETQNYQRVNGEDQSFGLTYDDLRDMMTTALDQGKEYSPMFTMSGPIVADAKVKGFDQKMAVLITANCISACDMTAFLFKNSKRAQIIGTHSNGTGAGFRSSDKLNTEWSDPLRVFSSTIPNFLFGRPGADPMQAVFGDSSVEDLCSENQPTMADVNYSISLTDLTKNNLGWLQKAAQVLEDK